MSAATCPECGDRFEKDAPWKKTCMPCWKESKRAEHDELLELREEVAEHRRLLSEILAERKAAAIPPDMLSAPDSSVPSGQARQQRGEQHGYLVPSGATRGSLVILPEQARPFGDNLAEAPPAPRHNDRHEAMRAGRSSPDA
jgi:hypothetical protein